MLRPRYPSFLRLTIVSWLILSCESGLALAGSVLYDGLEVEIQKSFGSGPNQTMFVIDWKSGTTPSYAWLYSWSDPSTTMDQALTQLEESEPSRFYYDAPGGFVLGLDYFDGAEEHPGNTQGFMSIWDSAGTGDGPDFRLNRGVAATLIDGGWAGINAAGVAPPDPYPGNPPRVPLATAVPEPTSLTLGSLAIVMAGCGAARQRRRG
jgi:hypothetical protein